MRPLLIGVGNSLRGDDGVGRELVHRLRVMLANGAIPYDGFDICESDGNALSLVDLWSGRQDVAIVDAVMDPTKVPGTLLILDPNDISAMSKTGPSSTHSLGLAEAINISKSLHTLPQRLTVFGIVGDAFGIDDNVSAGVAIAVEHLANSLASCLERRG